jgi:hypothetical protein
MIESNQQLMINYTSVILYLEYEKFKEIQRSLYGVIDQASTINIVVSNWSNYFSSTFSKLKSQRSVLQDLKKNKKVTLESKMRTNMATQIEN